MPMNCNFVFPERMGSVVSFQRRVFKTKPGVDKPLQGDDIKDEAYVR